MKNEEKWASVLPNPPPTSHEEDNPIPAHPIED